MHHRPAAEYGSHLAVAVAVAVAVAAVVVVAVDRCRTGTLKPSPQFNTSPTSIATA